MKAKPHVLESQANVFDRIGWFLYMNSFYNNFSGMYLDLKSQEMRQFKENLKIGCRQPSTKCSRIETKIWPRH